MNLTVRETGSNETTQEMRDKKIGEILDGE